MTVVVRFPRHLLYRCRGTEAQCVEGRCMFCSGGLAWCVSCSGGEAELPTECPQEPMHEQERAAVANGHLDFIRGRWVPTSEEARG